MSDSGSNPSGAMPTSTTDAVPRPRRPWVVPCLTKHESLSVLTRQEYPPGYGPIDPYDGSMAAVPCSQGFCP